MEWWRNSNFIYNFKASQIYSHYLSNFSSDLQKQPPELLYKRVSIKELFLKIRYIHRKTPVLESLFNKAFIKIKLFIKIKQTPIQVFSREYCEIFKNTYFEEHTRTTASGSPTPHPVFMNLLPSWYTT